LVRAEQLKRVYTSGKSEQAALDGVSLEVEKGETILVFGPSGCGKSTLLNVMGGLDRAYSGKLWLFGREVSALSDRELSRLRAQRIGFVFQAFHLLDHLNVLDNVAAPALFGAEGFVHKQAAARSLELLERVQLADRANAVPAELSGGQRQRVAIARALFNAPELLLCDEPTGNLDRDSGARIIELFASLHETLGTSFVIVTHEERLSKIARRTLYMSDGKLVPP
jgi:putative ABC transport system ATP-binding protein